MKYIDQSLNCSDHDPKLIYDLGNKYNFSKKELAPFIQLKIEPDIDKIIDIYQKPKWDKKSLQNRPKSLIEKS